MKEINQQSLTVIIDNDYILKLFSLLWMICKWDIKVKMLKCKNMKQRKQLLHRYR